MVESLLKLVDFLAKHKIDYCIIGGLAMLLHHGRANTVDIDIYVMSSDLDKIFRLFEKNRFPVRKAGDSQLKAKFEDVPVDILLADPHLGEDVVLRAVPRLLNDKVVRIATPEDLIILKTIADRSIDRRDIEELRELFGKKLDEDYIRAKLSKIKKLMA